MAYLLIISYSCGFLWEIMYDVNKCRNLLKYIYIKRVRFSRINGGSKLIIAHSSPDGKKVPQSLEDHTEGVMKKAIEFSQSFDPFGITAVAALAHDLGKKTQEFQDYIRSDDPKRGTVRHALGGTMVLNEIQDVRATLSGLLVAGHHSGLPDADKLNERISNAVSYLKRVPEISKHEKEQIKNILKRFKSLPHVTKESTAYANLLLKMCFSALVDADFQDTERYMDQVKSDARKAVTKASMEALYQKLTLHMTRLMDQSDASPLNKRRKEVYEACIQEALKSSSFRSLNVPTGLGKTLAAMGFALKNARKYKKRRVICAIPFVSIIDQNAEVYKSVFGDDNILEHHSQVSFSEDKDEEMCPMRLAAENWDRPIIVTTTVQLFESLFSNKTSKCRKLHNIADSVIILDEFQQLPFKVLAPIFKKLKTLMDHFNVTVLVTSATPLSFDKPELFGCIDPPEEIYKKNRLLFEEMKRVDYVHIDNALSLQELIDHMKNHQQFLCIVNTKSDALRIYRELEKTNAVWDNVYHLSTSMCPIHRKMTIDQIRKDLVNDKSIAVISTQLIEAGVDFDFPRVYRAIAPLDSLVQAAGRCNREGKLETGKVFIFDLEDGGCPPGIYKAGADISSIILSEKGTKKLHQLDLYNDYFRMLYASQSEGGTDYYQINNLRPFKYETVNKLFKMIDQDTVTVICRYFSTDNQIKEDISQRIERLIKEIEFLPFLSRSWYREAQQYSVSLYRNSKFFRENRHLLTEINDQWYIWEGKYDKETGITANLQYNPDELIF